MVCTVLSPSDGGENLHTHSLSLQTPLGLYMSERVSQVYTFTKKMFGRKCNLFCPTENTASFLQTSPELQKLHKIHTAI